MSHETPNASELDAIKVKLSKMLGKDITGNPGGSTSSPVPPAPTLRRAVLPPPSPTRLSGAPLGKGSLEERFVKGAPELSRHAKTLSNVLEKNSLNNTVAKVALVLDISGSMGGQYRNGSVQQIINKTLPIAVQLSDNSQLELWYYGSLAKRMSSVRIANYKSAVPVDWENLMKSLGYGNDEPKVMRPVIDEFKSRSLPAYILFITDGGIRGDSEIKSLLDESSRYPIFWQFVGVGGSDYGILEGLDRSSKNASFFALDDFKSVGDEELYKRLLTKFPACLRQRGCSFSQLK